MFTQKTIMSNFKINKAGTVYFTDENGILKYQCQYCSEWFAPTTRDKQKFCHPSCSTRACRERKHGVGGTLYKKRDATSNSELLKQLKVIEERTVSSIEHMYSKLLDRQYEHEQKLQTEIVKLNGKVKTVSKQLNWLMLITAIAPVVSPAVASWLKEVALGQKPAIEGIQEELAAIRNCLDEPTKLRIKKLLKEEKLEQYASLLGV